MSDLRIRYQTFELGSLDVHVRALRDRQQYSDDSGRARRLGIPAASWAHFGVLWESGHALARLMVDFDVGERRVLEVGCGIGLASLVLSMRAADITATDRHPDGEAFLHTNCALNARMPIPFVRCNWTEEAPELARFDLIIGADLLYEPNHAYDLSKFIDRHANPRVEVVILDPRRGSCGRFVRHMRAAGYSEGSKLAVADDAEQGFSGRYLHFVR